ncbi:MAG: NTP transferase domain-containing protein, partial [Alphaproteobacteria bacterium]
PSRLASRAREVEAMISAIVLAAGFSTRMGMPKAMLPWEGAPLVRYQVEQLREAGVEDVVVVLGHRADEVHRLLHDTPCRVMLNARVFAGRAASLRLGARATNRDAETILVISVDQPRTAGFLRALLAGHQPANVITRPAHDGRHGHPIVLSGRLREELLNVDEATEGLRAIIRAHDVQISEVKLGPEALLDLNTPDDYASASGSSLPLS